MAEDLRALAGTRSRTSARDRVFPALFALLPPAVLEDRERRFAALKELIDQGIDRIDDPDHRRAAAPLFGFTAGRWRPLTERGQEAAVPFGLGWDAYRRRRTNGPSLLDETTEALARALQQVAPTGPPAGVLPPVLDALDDDGERHRADDRAGATADAPAADVGRTEPPRADPDPVLPGDPPAPPRRRTRSRLLAVGALVVLAISGVAGFMVIASPDAAARCSLLTGELGDLPPRPDAGMRAWAPAFRAATDRLGPGSTHCASPLERVDDLVAQRVSPGDGAPTALLIGVGPGHREVIGLHPDEFAELRRPGPVGDGSQQLGAPVRRADRGDGVRVVNFTEGAIVTQPHGPSRRVEGDYWRVWERAGGLEGELGRPVSAFYVARDDGIYVQEFEGGEITKDLDTPLEPHVVLGSHRAAPLPTNHRNSVLRTGDATAWLIGGDGVRHLIVDDQAYECATTEQGASATARISAAAIEDLPAGEEYTCP